LSSSDKPLPEKELTAALSEEDKDMIVNEI
jgi:hypothetical protein